MNAPFGVLFAVAVLAGGFLSAPVQLDGLVCARLWAASSGYCCDPDGSWTQCPGQPNNCPTKAPPLEGGIFLQVYGRVCNPDGAACQEASPGPYNAECEGSVWDVNCWYGQNQTNCNDLRSSTCDSDLDIISDPESPVTMYFYSCNCPGGTVVGMVSNRTTCFGDSCWW